MAELDKTQINSTGFLKLPAGSASQRPNNPETGMIRYNTDDNKVEIFDGSEWITIG